MTSTVGAALRPAPERPSSLATAVKVRANCPLRRRWVRAVVGRAHNVTLDPPRAVACHEMRP